MDISPSGAKLITDEPAPKDFVLSFSQADRRGSAAMWFGAMGRRSA
jgi:hypothetical protein